MSALARRLVNLTFDILSSAPVPVPEPEPEPIVNSNTFVAEIDFQVLYKRTILASFIILIISYIYKFWDVAKGFILRLIVVLFVALAISLLLAIFEGILNSYIEKFASLLFDLFN